MSKYLEWEIKYTMINRLIYKMLPFLSKKSYPYLQENINGEGNQINVNRTKFKNSILRIKGNNNQIVFEEECSFHQLLVYIKGDNNTIHVSKNVRLNKSGEFWIEDNNCSINIGSNTTFENVHIAATENKSKISIGENCMFASDIDIRTGDSHSILDNLTKQRLNYAQDVFIGNHVWVASHVSILKGSILSEDSVVATRSIVTKHFNKNVLIGGAPAKVLKININWDRERL
ncbi:acyltransferase [Formosa haliotis]|uniref:acyltransferase n=1 Tax=Formosa haliotis TaxID=1555194 RepID=UPI0008246501|nr:acyltransferase [Formosa haliotis]